MQVGSETAPFSGTFDGDGHTLTYNKGGKGDPFAVNETCAPFGCLNGANVRHLKSTGEVYTAHRLNGGIAAFIDGNNDTRGTTFFDCCSDINFWTDHDGGMVTGGIVGRVNSNVTMPPTLEKCVFTGHFRGLGKNWAGLVGWSYVDGVKFKNCMVDPTGLVPTAYTGSSIYVRLEEGCKATLEDCYCTRYIGVEQGVCVFSTITVPDGCTYEMVEEPFAQFYGKPYWKSGAHVMLTMPEGTSFHHWSDLTYPGAFVSDCFRMNGTHQLLDVKGPISLHIATQDIPKAETERTLWGVTYRYLSRKDYHYYVSDETCKAKGWRFENDDESDQNANLVVYDSENKPSEITAFTGYNESDYNDDGVQIHNDLVGNFRNHTHLGL